MRSSQMPPEFIEHWPISSIDMVEAELLLTAVSCGLWGGVALVLWLRARPVRVVVFRSFAAERDSAFKRAVQLVGAHWGRVDAIVAPGDTIEYVGWDERNWGIIGSSTSDRWQEAIQPMLRRASVAIVDVSKITDGLRFELSEISKARHVHVALIADRVDRSGAAMELWSKLFEVPPPPLVTYEGRSPIEFAQSLLDVMELQTKPFGPAWRVHRWYVMQSLERGLVLRGIRWFGIAIIGSIMVWGVVQCVRSLSP